MATAHEPIAEPIRQDDPFMDADQIAEYCNVTKRHAYRLMHERRVRVTKVGRYSRVRKSDIDAFLAANTIPARRK